MPRKKEPKSCGCGCGEMTSGGIFKPGHDQKLYSTILEKFGGLIGLKQFLEDTTGEEIVANHSKMSFKNEVTKRWKADGTQKWGYEVTKAMCLATNRDLEISGVNPAPKFREAITKNDEDYIKEWIMGCHFEWLNPR